MLDYFSAETSSGTAAITVSPPHFFGILKWPLMLVLLITSFPAGATPYIIAIAYSDLGHEEHVSHKWRDPQKIANRRQFLCNALVVLAVTGLIHAALVSLSVRKWNVPFLGLRGASWFSMAWGVFALGMAFGIWLYIVFPE